MVKIIDKAHSKYTEEEQKQRADAVARIQSEYGQELQGYARSLAGSAYMIDADDVIQEFWVRAMQRIPMDRMECKPYLYKVVHSCFLDLIRKRNRHDEKKESAKKNTLQEYFEDFTSLSSFKKEFWLRFCQIDITSKQQEIIWLYAIEGYSYTEISKMMGIPTSTLSDWVKDCQKKCRFGRLEGLIGSAPSGEFDDIFRDHEKVKNFVGYYVFRIKRMVKRIFQ